MLILQFPAVTSTSTVSVTKEIVDIFPLKQNETQLLWPVHLQIANTEVQPGINYSAREMKL